MLGMANSIGLVIIFFFCFQRAEYLREGWNVALYFDPRALFLGFLQNQALTTVKFECITLYMFDPSLPPMKQGSFVTLRILHCK